MNRNNFRFQIVAIALVVAALPACSGRKQEIIVGAKPSTSPNVHTSGSVPTESENPAGEVANPGEQGAEDDAQTAALAQSVGLSSEAFLQNAIYVHLWTGVDDEVPADQPWTVESLLTSASVPTTLPAGSTPPSAIPTAGAAATVAYTGRIDAILNANCTSCHRPGGREPTTPMDTYETAKSLGARIAIRAGEGTMPTSGPLNPADTEALKSWAAAGFPKDSGGASGTIPAVGAAGGAGSTDPLTLEITDQKYGNYLNQNPIQGKVGQTLKIVNKRTTGSFVIHTDGQPFDHGDVANPIPPGGSQTYIFQSPYSGEGGIYEHTDGSVNTDRLIKLTVQ